MLPRKPILAVLSFAAIALAPGIGWFNLALVAELLEAEVLTGKGGPLDHFYEALARGGTVRVLHFGDSPTTADLITADGRSVLQSQFGNAGAGFLLIARPRAWYNRRGLKMDSSGWKIEVAGAAESKDGLYGLGGVRFTGEEGAEATWTPGTGQDVAEVAFLYAPDGGAFTLEADGQMLGSWSTAAPVPVVNAGALVPFFEQLYRHQHGELPGPVGILQYGDSHRAADEFSGELHALVQSAFGNGGNGFTLAGSP